MLNLKIIKYNSHNKNQQSELCVFGVFEAWKRKLGMLHTSFEEKNSIQYHSFQNYHLAKEQ